MISSRLVLTIAIFGSAAKTTMAVDPIKCNSYQLVVVDDCATAAPLNDLINDTVTIACKENGDGNLKIFDGCDAGAAALNDLVKDKGVDAISCLDSPKFNPATGLFGPSYNSVGGNGAILIVGGGGGDCAATACALNALINASDATCVPTWQAAMNGCCREHVPGAPKRQRYLNHHDSLISTETIDGGTMDNAIDTCKLLCEDKNNCTAVEIHASKKTRNSKNKKNKKKKKKTSKGFACELHTASINSSSRKNKSCKKAKCFTMDQSE